MEELQQWCVLGVGKKRVHASDGSHGVMARAQPYSSLKTSLVVSCPRCGTSDLTAQTLHEIARIKRPPWNANG